MCRVRLECVGEGVRGRGGGVCRMRKLKLV